jgi:hypothetical protein
MKGFILATAIIGLAVSSSALARMVETIVYTATRVDSSKMHDEERLAHICQASTVLKIHLASERNRDWATGDATDWIIELSCSRAKRR